MKIPKNEGRCLDAVIRVLEHEHNAKRSNLRCPERCGDLHPVELVCKIGSTNYALEHTIVESFYNQIGDGINFLGMTDALITELQKRLPANGLVQVVVPISATTGIKRHKVPGIRNFLGDWIVSAAHRLKQKSHRGIESGRPDGVPFSVDVIWHSWPASAKIFFTRGVKQRTLDEGREEQLASRISSKISKLQGWSKADTLDVLILENWDGALSNVMTVKDTFANVIQQFTHVPTSVYVVDTFIDSQWTVWALRRNEIYQSILPYWEFDPSELADPRSQLS